MEELFKTLGDENRLRILQILLERECCVCELEVLLEMTQSNVSRHLRKLKNAGFISSYKTAQWMHYKMDESFMKDNELLIAYLRDAFTQDNGIKKKDRQRYAIYTEKAITCKNIAEQKNQVLSTLDMEGKVND